MSACDVLFHCVALSGRAETGNSTHLHANKSLRHHKGTFPCQNHLLDRS
jgi:hypothetical protein